MKRTFITPRSYAVCAAGFCLLGIILRTVCMLTQFDAEVEYFNQGWLSAASRVLYFIAVVCFVAGAFALPKGSVTSGLTSRAHTIAAYLLALINKDEEGNPTGEPFALGALVEGLLEDVVFTDSLINTIIQYVYPLVCKEFAKVWAGLPSTFTALGVETGVSLAPTADVKDCPLYLDDVEKAIAAVGVYLSPVKLAENLKNNADYDDYTQVIAKLESATTKAVYNLNGDGDDDDTFQNPWEDANLFKNVYDEETGEQVFNDDGTPKQVYDLNWGIDEATDKRAAFVNAACAALSE